MHSKPNILFLHAITRSAADYDSFAELVGDRFNTHVPDLLGHGRQRRSDTYRLADYRDALLTDLPSEGDLILWGHSLGGLVALALAEKIGSRTSAIILEDVPLFEVDWPRFRDGPFYDGFKFLFETLSNEGLDKPKLEIEVAGWPSGSGDRTYAEHFGPKGVEQRTTELMALDPKTLEPPMTGKIHGEVDIRKVLSQVRCPVHLLAGSRENGSALSVDDLAEFRRVCPTGKVHQFSHLGHDIRLFEEHAGAGIVYSLAYDG